MKDRWLAVIARGRDVRGEIEMFKRYARGEFPLPGDDDPNYGGWTEFEFGELACSMEDAVKRKDQGGRQRRAEFVSNWQTRLQEQSREGNRRRVPTKTLGEVFKTDLSPEQRQNVKIFIEQFVYGNNLISSYAQRILLQRVNTTRGPWIEPTDRIDRVFESEDTIHIWRNGGGNITIKLPSDNRYR